MSKKVKKEIYSADFETTTDINDCRVWAYAFYNIYEEFVEEIGNNIDDFFSFLEKKNTEVYFHNEKFDGQFIIYWLETNGYTYSKKESPKTYNTLITDTGQYYSIKITFGENKKNKYKTVLKDSLKKLPFPVSVIAKTFNLEEQKLEINYNEYRPIGHILTPIEEAYLKNDVIIVGKALKVQFDSGLGKLTVASDSMNYFKEDLKQEFNQYFPVLPLDIDDYIRKSYKGGWTYLKPNYANKKVGKGVVFDVNSLYPSVMYNCYLPFGLPVFFEGEYTPSKFYPCYIQRIRASFKIKKGYLPTIQLKNNPSYMATEYLTSTWDEELGIYKIEDLTLTNVDLDLFLKHYEVLYIEFLDGYKFRASKNMFKAYIDYWGKIKETSTGARRQLAKLMLNSLYGKFASNPRKLTKIPFLNDEGYISYKIPQREEYNSKGEIELVDDIEITDPVYTAVASFITSYARAKTISSAQAVYDRFIYADTDSLHLIGEDIPECLEVDPVKLGYWKHESTFDKALFVRAKTYLEESNGKLEVKCAGMPENLKKTVTFENFHSGAKFFGKLIPKNCKGGCVLVPTEFTIK